MSTHVVPAANWSDALAEILRKAQPGDTIAVRSDAMRQLALGAAERMGRVGLTIEVQTPAKP